MSGAAPLRIPGLRRYAPYSYGIENLLPILHWSPMLARSVSVERATMPAQERELRRNYIGILSDKIEEQRTVESLAKSDGRMKDYLLDLMTAELNHRSAAR
jgi:hypothetical protein